MPSNAAPSADGQHNVYTPDSYSDWSAWPDRCRRAIEKLNSDGRPSGWQVVFVNGMNVTSIEHKTCGRRLASILNHDVRGIYNLTGSSGVRTGMWSFMTDLRQCARDYLNPVGLAAPPGYYQLARWVYGGGRDEDVGRFMLNSNMAALSVFLHLLSCARRGQPVVVVCHSQGNLITANALWVLKNVRGRLGMGKVRVFGLATPAPSWPSNNAGGLKYWLYHDRWDPVTWIGSAINTANEEVSGSAMVDADGGVMKYHDIDHYFANPAFLEQVRAVLCS
ncbi:MAG: hypothetical protein AAFR38_07640 [Planctomycetota bacterium]